MSEDRKEVVVCGDGEGLHHEVFVGSHRLAADEPPESGGSDRGPNPYDLLLASKDWRFHGSHYSSSHTTLSEDAIGNSVNKGKRKGPAPNEPDPRLASRP
jgi:hypothetical protein